MLNFYILCKHLKEAVEKQQPLEDIIKRIVDAVNSYNFEEEQND